MIIERCVMRMKGSIVAAQIIDEQRREEAYKKKAIRMQCIVDKKKQCDQCRYKDICEDVEVRNEV